MQQPRVRKGETVIPQFLPQKCSTYENNQTVLQTLPQGSPFVLRGRNLHGTAWLSRLGASGLHQLFPSLFSIGLGRVRPIAQRLTGSKLCRLHEAAESLTGFFIGQSSELHVTRVLLYSELPKDDKT